MNIVTLTRTTTKPVSQTATIKGLLFIIRLLVVDVFLFLIYMLNIDFLVFVVIIVGDYCNFRTKFK